MRQKFILFIFLLALMICLPHPAWLTPSQPVQAQATDWSQEWAMAGANPQRTSWNNQEVRGKLVPLWYKPIEPYISQKVQIIAANDLLYISTARGLYALDALTGAEKWVFPTALPLGNAPTIYNGVAYVGGMDKQLYALDALTGARLWSFEAEAGFETNPLVVGDKVFLGNRDGTFYAVYADRTTGGGLAWQFKTDGPILFSAAYDNGTVYFASNDSYAYALNADTGQLVWKSFKLPGAGFHSWWPIVYNGRLILAASSNYRTSVYPGAGSQLTQMELNELYPNHATDPRGTPIGNYNIDPNTGQKTIDLTRIFVYLQAKPWRRSYIILNLANGQEAETYPVLWTGTHSGNRYPPIVGGNGVLYQQANYLSDPYIAGGHIAGWRLGASRMDIVNGGWNAVDEPVAYSAGGNMVYWNRCCDRIMGGFDVTIPVDQANRAWVYYTYDLDRKIPGYNSQYYMSTTNSYASFGGENGVYGYHGDTNAPIPYHGMLFVHRGNSVIAFGAGAGYTALPMAATVTSAVQPASYVDNATLRAALKDQVERMLAAGHLRPFYSNHGIFNLRGQHQCGDDLVDYWHNSGDTLFTLTMALPYLDSATQTQVQNYMAQELADYPPYLYNHNGWEGSAREVFDLPPEVASSLGNYGPRTENATFKNSGGWQNRGVWARNPFAFYALWKYAAAYPGDKAGLAANLLSTGGNNLVDPPDDAVLINMPEVTNAFIAGYWGYLGLQDLAGQAHDTFVQTELERMINLRLGNFSQNSPYAIYGQGSSALAYCRTLNVARNFMFLTPELADLMRSQMLPQVTAALDEAERIAPYWFESLAEEGFAENIITPLYDGQAIFMARAWILQQTGDVLLPYLDVPAVPRGDLFYIQKLTAVLQNEVYGFVVLAQPLQINVTDGGTAVYTLAIQPTGGFNSPVNLTITPPNDVNVIPSTTTIPPANSATITVTDLAGGASGWHFIPIQLSGGGITQTITLRMLVDGSQIYFALGAKK